MMQREKLKNKYTLKTKTKKKVQTVKNPRDLLFTHHLFRLKYQLRGLELLITSYVGTAVDVVDL
jgi:hypothetical protein